MNEDIYAARQVAEIASAMLDGSTRPLLGARMLIGYLHRLKKEVDPEIFRLIQGVDSECDGLPIGSERRYWAPEASAQKDRRADKYEMATRTELLEAANRLLAQYHDKISLR